jgi:outer membrane protein assembly factor BamB
VIGGATIIEVVTLLRITISIIFACLATASSQSQSLPSATRWTVALPATAVASPTIAGDVVVVPLQSGQVVAYSVADGKEAWRAQLRTGQSIVADQTLLFVAAGDMIRAMDAADGKVLWEAPSGAVTAPLLVHGGWVIAASEGQLAAFREIDGAKVWTVPCPPLHVRPSIEGDNLYVPTDEGRLLALDVKTGAERWTKFPAKGPLSEVLALSNRVYVGASNKTLYVYDPDTGDVKWLQPLGTLLRGAPVSDGKRVIVTGIDNLVRAYDRGNGRLDWHEAVPYRPTGAAIVGSVVVVPGAAPLIQAFELASGKSAGQIKLEKPLLVAPAFAGAGADVLTAGITGTVTGEWTLVLVGPPAAQAPPE